MTGAFISVNRWWPGISLEKEKHLNQQVSKAIILWVIIMCMFGEELKKQMQMLIADGMSKEDG